MAGEFTLLFVYGSSPHSLVSLVVQRPMAARDGRAEEPGLLLPTCIFPTPVLLLVS